MISFLKKSGAFVLVIGLLIAFFSCGKDETDSRRVGDGRTAFPDAEVIELDGENATWNGVTVETFDLTWHCDPSVSHDDVKNAPAEYWTGTTPGTEKAVYIDHALPYFPKLDEAGFRLVNYDGETEWAYSYTDGEHNDYLFGTLPKLGTSLPSQMMHTEEEAAQNQVLHITKPGTYLLEGEWNGQILINLGETDDVFADESQKVTLILNGADIRCTVAPGVIFENVYECDNMWEDREANTVAVSTENAGATVVVADGSVNFISGTNVYRMLKTKYKDDADTGEIKTQKKMRKTDGALYSYMSMNLNGGKAGTGKLTVTSGYEGIDSELHLSFNGGVYVIRSQDDGCNVNEDHVSVIAFNGGDLTIHAALGAEGDGVDSNGFIAVNGGVIRIDGIRAPDSALDSEDGIYYQAGKLILDGKEQTYSAGSVFRETGSQNQPGFPDGTGDFGGRDFPGRQSDPRGGFGAEFDIRKFKEQVAALGDDATLDDVLALLGMGGQGGADFPTQGGERPPEPPAGR